MLGIIIPLGEWQLAWQFNLAWLKTISACIINDTSLKSFHVGPILLVLYSGLGHPFSHRSINQIPSNPNFVEREKTSIDFISSYKPKTRI